MKRKDVQDDDDASVVETRNPRVVMVPVVELVAKAEDNPRFSGAKDPVQASKKFLSSERFDFMRRSFDKVGIKTPVLIDERKRVIDGWCRTAWAKEKDAKKPGKKIACIVVNPTDTSQRLTLQVAMNTARRGYDPIAKAHAFKALSAVWGTALNVAKHCGVSGTTVTDTISLLDLDSKAQRLLIDGKITQQCAERIMKMPGFKDWRAQRAFAEGEKGAKALSETSEEAALEFDDRLNYVLDIATGDEDRFSHEDLAQAWNSYSKTATKVKESEDRPTKKKSKDKSKSKDKKKAAPAKVNTAHVAAVAPTVSSIEDAMELYGRAIAEEMVGDSTDADVVSRLKERIEHLGVAIGWCVPKDLRDVILSKKGKPLYADEVADTLCHELIAEFTLIGLLKLREEKSGRVLAADDPLSATKNDAAWDKFYKQDKGLSALVKELDARLVKPVAG